ncbi:12702_t:CDS:1, partial [Gigaspora rosea]
MNEEETVSLTITTIDVTLIETDPGVETTEIKIITVEIEVALGIEIVVIIEMTTTVEVVTDLLPEDLPIELPHHIIK